jgi:hypothetical protein
VLTIDDLFYVEYGQHDLTYKGDLADGNTIVISSQGVNNGCYGFFSVEPKYDPPFITVPRTGSIGQAFVQEFPCAVTDDLLLLKPKTEMEVEKLYFVAAVIRQDKWRYNYGRKITPTRLKSLEIDFSKIKVSEINNIRKNWLGKIGTFQKALELKQYDFSRERTAIGKLFNIYYGQREIHSKGHLLEGQTLVISSQGQDNGCYGFYDIQPKYKRLIISVPNTGSIGMAFVQEYPCCIDDNCLVLSPKEGIQVSIEEMYFAASIIRLDSWRYRYGRQITDRRFAKLEIDFSKFNYAKTKALRERIEAILE